MSARPKVRIRKDARHVPRRYLDADVRVLRRRMLGAGPHKTDWLYVVAEDGVEFQIRADRVEGLDG